LMFPLEKSTTWPDIADREDFELCQKILQLQFCERPMLQPLVRLRTGLICALKTSMTP
jgi:hypothetical protein